MESEDDERVFCIDIIEQNGGDVEAVHLGKD